MFNSILYLIHPENSLLFFSNRVFFINPELMEDKWERVLRCEETVCRLELKLLTQVCWPRLLVDGTNRN